ncbi:hypothetical protein GGR51DRAFT_552722 [Nemania sp. FL0031]|nr:hypothetical protein GGR51DRAFT_552722 [Nemania sp. FL0031]
MDDQPVLEVATSAFSQPASHALSTLQAIPTSSETSPEVVPFELLNGQSAGLEVVQPLEEREKWLTEGSSKNIHSVLVNLNQKPHTASYRRRVLIGVGILAIVVVAVTVGSIMGSRHSGSLAHGTPASDVTPNSLLPTLPSPSPTVTLTPLYPNQSPLRLAVSGWRTTGGLFYFRVFYQDKDDSLWFLQYNSDGNTWGSPTKVEIEGAMSDTALGAAVVRNYSPPQYELFFLNESFVVTGDNFQDRIAPLSGRPDSIGSYPVSAYSRSRLGTYWPHIALQKPNSTLHFIYWTPGWGSLSLGINALPGTSLAIVPRSTSYNNPYPAALVYQRNDGVIALYSLEVGKIGYEWSVVTINKTQSSSFGAFAVARENDPADATNIYILYQTASNDLQYVYYDGDLWKLGPTSDALRNADAFTDIACLTESIWYGQGSMSVGYDMSRCYFFSGGKVKEVWFDGTMWTDKGYIL